MQRLYLVFSKTPRTESAETNEAEDYERLEHLSADLSVLIETGRIFFKNRPGKNEPANWGNKKPLAYQGIRPKVLDYLVACYDASQEWRRADPARRRDLLDAVLESERQFVSLMQCEVGRAKSLSIETRTPGKRSPLTWILQDLRARETRFDKRNVR